MAWSIAPWGIATVEVATGLVTAVAPGDAVVSVTSTFDASKSDTVDLTVNPPFEPVTLDFVDTTSITIPDVGPADPYPSTIFVADMPRTLLSVSVALFGVTHAWPDDLDVLLVGPGGEATILMSDTGGGFDLADVTLGFAMEASESLPDSAPIGSGTYVPTDFGAGDGFPVPAPAGPFEVTLDGFSGTDPTGTWSLFVLDDSSGDEGSIAGRWSITITSF